MSRTRILLAALAAVLAATAVAVQSSAVARPRAHASSALQIGISDNHPATFSDPRFRWLGMGIARLVVPWDIVKRRTELGWENAWLQAARAAGVKPLIVFDKDPSHPRSLPSVAAYGKAVKAFMALYPWVQDYSPWNEENHYLEPTSRDPKRAAQYFNLFATLCPTCTVTAADVLDIGNMSDWTRKFLRYAHSPRYWGLHNYTDLSAGSHARTSLFLRIVPGTVWFTETGGVVWRYEHPNSGRRGYFIAHSEGYAAEVAGHLLALAHVSSRVTRVYYYQWRVPNTLAWARAHHAKLSWDSGVLRPDCAIRPAFRVIARAMGKNPSRTPRYKRDRAGNCLSLTPLPVVATGSAPAPASGSTPAGGSPTTKQGGAAAP
jgi:polysaccharide biosynthesis protein PslG